MKLLRSSPHLLWTLATLALLLAWDASGLDMVLARPLAGEYGFFWRDHWLLAGLLHEGVRRAAWVPTIWIMVSIWWPTGTLARLPRAERIQFAATMLLLLAAISFFKQASSTSCPWDLAAFHGRANAVWLSHWAMAVSDGGGGRCFPAGHASAGFAFLGGYFAMRRVLPAQARAWLIGAMAAGFILGISQQLRGAHFMSHTLWTAWLCWTIAWLIDLFAQRLKASRLPAVPETPALPAAQAPAN